MRSTTRYLAPTPFQFTARADWEDGKLQTEVAFDVPKNRRLVIEHISATLECPIAQEITYVQVRTTLDKVIAWHSVFVPKTSTIGKDLSIYCGGQRVRIYADAGTPVIVLVGKNISQCSFPCGTTMVFVSGYLLPLNSPTLGP
jgi:hypothetical protein